MNSLSNSNTISNIPLHCNVCPKRPDFSDVSHLLTHVASKGHLSNYYKMKVKSGSDPISKQIVDDYDDWYETWNLEALMGDRMSQKEKKRSGGNGAGTRRTATTHSARSTPSIAPPRGNRSNRLLPTNLQLLDPQLGNRQRVDPLSRSGTPGSAFSYESLPSRTYYPPATMGISYNGGHWGPDEDYSPPIKQESVESESSDEDYDDTYRIQTRSSARRRTARPQHFRSDTAASTFDDDVSNEDNLATYDRTKLKGIFWPGMDIFDSATPEMRRKRNQKKHFSVLVSLEATSKMVEPTECVYKDGVLEREREITGSPNSEDDPLEGESEPEPEVTEKKRGRRRGAPRQPMQDRNTNTGRVSRTRGQPHHPGFGRDNRAAYFDGADDDGDLTYGQHRPKKRSGLSIHRDNTGPEITFDTQRPMNYLTAGYQTMPSSLSNSNGFQGLQNSFVPRSHARQPSWGQMGFRPSPAAGSHQFGQFFQPSTAMPMPMANQNPLAAFSQGYSMPQQPALQPTNNPLFQADTTSWGPLGLDQSNSFGVWSPTDNALDNNTLNPMLFNTANEDDDATISAKSEH